MIKNYNKTVETNHKPDRPYIPDHPYRILTLIKLGFYEASFFWGRGSI